MQAIPGSGKTPGEGNVTPLQCSCLENPMDRGAWRATVHGVSRAGHNLATKERDKETLRVDNFSWELFCPLEDAEQPLGSYPPDDSLSSVNVPTVSPEDKVTSG